MHQILLSLWLSNHFLLPTAIVAQVDTAYARSGGEVSPFAMLIQFIITLGSYIFSSLCLQKIFDRLSVKDSWLAWVPIANAVKVFQTGGQNPWFLLLFLIPIIGPIAALVFFVMAMMNITKQLGKATWIGIATIVPLLGLWAMYNLAFS